MNWTLPAFIAAIVVSLFFVKWRVFISAGGARRYLADGAVVIDVRSATEFRNGQVPGALNIPLDQFRAELPRVVPDKNQVLLLHCLGGVRSAVARRQARRLGYARVYNLGSFRRARRLARAALI